MEDMVIMNNFWLDKTVFITGHTGFKGGWLSLWLQKLGAKIYGYSLAPSTEPNFFTAAHVEENMTDSKIADIRDAATLKSAMQQAQPDIVFHLAAQPLVRRSYTAPVETYTTNVMGAVNLLEAVRATPTIRAIVIITTDKCYENHEWVWGYRENDPLGGYDPYSSSKACAELIAAAYRRSFLEKSGVALATVRAGNVIGGGDWSTDRLIPDFLRAVDLGETLRIRSPGAIRPWQHALEPLAGYLMLAEKLFDLDNDFAEAWNFGPADEDARSVRWIVERLASVMPTAQWTCNNDEEHPHEATYLKLDSSKARNRLGWAPQWSLKVALNKTVEWHTAWRSGKNMHTATLAQISEYEKNRANT